MKISVIIPVYNVEKYLDRCVASVVGQVHSDLEILLVDDGSTDGSGVLCDRWEEKDFRIRAFHKENGGLSSARNYGLEHATGDYICFVDSDDWLSVDFCRTLLDACIEYDCKIAMCDFLRTESEVAECPKGKTQLLQQREALHFLDAREEERYAVITVAWNKLYHRSVLERVRYPEGKIHEDEYVIAEVLLKSERIAYIQEPLYYYFQRSDSITGSANRLDERHLDVLDAYRKRSEILHQAGYEDMAVIAWRNQMLTMIEMLESKRYAPDPSLRKRMKATFRTALSDEKQRIPLRLRVKYQLYDLIPAIYRKLFFIRDV